MGEEHPDTLLALNSLGLLLQDQGEFNEAESHFRKVLEDARRLLGKDHLHTLAYLGNLGRLLRKRGKLDEADTILRKALEAKRRALGRRSSIHHIYIQRNWVIFREHKGKLDKAEAYCRKALKDARRVMGKNHVRTSKIGISLAEVLLDSGTAQLEQNHFESTESQLLEAHTLLLELAPSESSRISDCVKQLIALYNALHQAKPEAGYDSKVQAWRKALKDGD